MRVELGAHVQSRDEHDVGQIDKLILDRQRGVVSGVVLRQGGLLHKDIQIPLTELQTDAAGQLSLTYTADTVRAMPAYAAPGSATLSDRPDMTAMVAQYELEHAVVHAGTAIKDSQGKKIGTVHRIGFELPSGRLTHFVLRRGLLATETIDLPPELIASLGQDEIDLASPAAEIEQWAKLSSGLEVYANDETCLGSITERHATSLEVSSPDRRAPLFVPLMSVARVEDDRVVLKVDASHAALWRTPPGSEATTSTAEPLG